MTALVAVYDTMLFFRAASQPARIHTSMRAVNDGRVSLCLSTELIAEVTDVLSRPEYQARFPALRPKAVEVFLEDVLSHGKLFDPIPHVFSWTQHPDDDHIFNLAIAAKADYLVTWESRILKLGSSTTDDAKQLKALAPQLEIITPKELADLLKVA